MSGEGWVMGIIWHVLVLARNTIVDVWGGWSMEILLGASFLMQLVLTFSAGFRWRGDSPMLRNVIWLFYVSGDFVATLALGHLSVSGTSGKRRLVAFWAPFFLLHLGGPDSITAYELEDNQLSARYVLELVLRVTGAVYIVYKSISGSWALVPAAWLMLFVGVAKYTEKTLALHGANLVNVRSSVERQQQHQRTEGGSRHPRKLAFEVDDDDNDLVMKAHSLFHICKNSIVDSSVVAESDIEDAVAAQTKKTLFGLEWKELFTVMEIELSLMYDFLYTKAAIIHTWHGYCIRVLSPLATTVSLVLVELSNEGGRRHKRSDIVITRVLLVATFLLELASLLRALSSTWTGFLLHNKLRPGWIRHEVLCMRRWHRFHSVIMSLGWPAKVQAHRQWLGKMGQLNMLQLVITQKELERPAPKGGQFWDKEYQRCSKNTMIIPKEVKKLVLERVSIHLKKLRDLMKRAVVQARVEAVPEDADLLKMAVFLRTERGQETIEKNDKLSDLRWSLGDEPQLDILTWHIATDMFLLLSGKAAEAKDEGTGDEGLKVEAIMTLSNYMMYLLVVSPYMLPGLVTRKIIKLSCEDLARIWSEHWPPPAAADHLESSSSSPSFCNVRFFMPSKFFSQYGQWRVPTRLSQGREDLAKMLMDWHKSRDNAVTLNTYLHGGVRLAMNMLHVEKRHNKEELDIVQVILDVWVSMLFYASYQCSKESHAKQLSQGGELTTIVWLMAEHFGLFIVNKTSKGTEDNGRTGKEAKASDSQNV